MLRTGLTRLLGGRVPVEQRVVHDQHEAAMLGMCGSPTLLINGVDPFADRSQPPSLSCRLYRDETGALTGSPSLVQLRTALTGKALTHD